MLFLDEGPEFERAKLDVKDPIRSSLKIFGDENVELKNDLHLTGMIVCDQGLSKYERLDL